MASHLDTAIHLLSSDIRGVRRYERTGWEDDVFLLPGRDLDTRIEVSLPNTLPYEADRDADLERGQKALGRLIVAMDPQQTLPLFVFALTGPVVKRLPRVKRYGFFVKGRTNSLKPTWTQTLMAIWGAGFLEDTMLPH